MTESTTPNSVSVMPGAPHGNFLSRGNEGSVGGAGCKTITDCHTSISTPSSGTQDSTNTNTNTAVYTNTIPIPRKNYIASIKVPREVWNTFLHKARELGFSGNELINQFINSIALQAAPLQPRSQVTFNVAIAKAESKPVVNLGEYVALKQLDELLQNAKKVKERAEREAQSDGRFFTFTVERAKKLEEELLKAMRNLRSLTPEKLQEVEAALSILKSIREGKP